MRPLPLTAAQSLMTAESARAQGDAASPDGTVPTPRTVSADAAVHPLGHAPSGVEVSGTTRIARMCAPAQDASSLIENSAWIRMAGFGIVTPLTRSRAAPGAAAPTGNAAPPTSSRGSRYPDPTTDPRSDAPWRPRP